MTTDYTEDSMPEDDLIDLVFDDEPETESEDDGVCEEFEFEEWE